MRTAARAFAVLTASMLSASCINLGLGGDGKLPAMHRHVLEASENVAQKPRSGPTHALAVRPFAARSRYDVRVVRRDGPDDFAYLEFERWGETPPDAATDVVREDLAASGAFAFVSSAVDAMIVDQFLDGYVLACDLVKTPSGPWKARFAARLSLSTPDGKMLHTAIYETSRDLPGPSPEGLGPAMSAAVGDAVNRAIADWAAAPPK